MTKRSGKAVKVDNAASPPAPSAPAPRAPRETRGAVKASSSNFVSVACKLPNGLMLQNYNMVDSGEPISGGGRRMVKVAQKDGAAIRVHGTARRLGEGPRCQIVMGFAITKNIPSAFWDRWLAANAESSVVKNGLIFANPDGESLREEAKDKRKVFSGLEPLAANGDHRAPSNKKKKLKVETAPESSTPETSDRDPENVEPDED